MLVDSIGRPTSENPGFTQWRRRLGAATWLVVGALPASVAVSVGEWWTRVSHRPVPGEWWTESWVLGIAGGVAQGLIIGTMIVVAVVMTAFCWTVLDLAAGRFEVRTTLDARSADGRGGFGRFEECLESILAAASLLYAALWAASVQHIAIERTLETGRHVALQTVLFSGSWFDVGVSHYSIQMAIIACATTLTMAGLMVYWLHRAYWATVLRSRTEGTAPWLLPHFPLPALVGALMLAQVCFVFFKFSMVVLALLVVVIVYRMGRALSPSFST